MILLTENVVLDGRAYKINVYHDPDVDSPLEGSDVKITYKQGSHYILGNEPLDADAHSEIAARINAFDNPGRRLAAALDDGSDIGEPLIGLKVHAYIHSGIALSTSPWGGRLPQGHAEFDSAQSGFVYISKEHALEWQGGKRLTGKKIAAMKRTLSSLVEEFGRWVNGDCYYYDIEDEEGNRLDGCGGFIGTEYMLTEAKALVQDLHKKHLAEKKEALYWHERGVPTVSRHP